jgi:virginiamycin B lyase
LSFSSSDHTFRVYNMSTMISEPVGIVEDSQGNLWITEHGPSLVAEFNPRTDYFRAITTNVPAYFGTSLPYFVYIDSKGNVWFNEHEGNAIARFSPSNSSLVEYMIPTKVTNDQNISGALTMALSPQGTPWFTEFFAGKVGKVNLQVPITLGLSIQNFTTESVLTLKPGQDLSLELNCSSTSHSSVGLSLFLSTYNLSYPVVYPISAIQNTTEPAFVYSFSSASGTGDFSSYLTIKDQNLANGTYYLTVSEISTDIRVSRIIEINVS